MFKGVKRLIFLDYDGVVNRFAQSHRDPDVVRAVYAIHNRRLVGNLNRLVFATGAHVVISSALRDTEGLGFRCADTLEQAGFVGDVIGETPELPTRACRGDEIAAWLARYMPVGFNDYVILDDCLSFLPNQMPHVVHTASREGLTSEKVDEAIACYKRLSIGN